MFDIVKQISYISIKIRAYNARDLDPDFRHFDQISGHFDQHIRDIDQHFRYFGLNVRDFSQISRRFWSKS